MKCMVLGWKLWYQNKVFTHWIFTGDEENIPLPNIIPGWVISFKFF